TLCGAFLAYGTHPGWIGFPHGLSLIIVARRLQWPLAAFSLICCVGMIGLVIAGRRSAWWLLGLAPVLALFMHRFATGSVNRFAICDNPAFVAADAARINDADSVVGLAFGDSFYAYPYAVLNAVPVVLQSDR